MQRQALCWSDLLGRSGNAAKCYSAGSNCFFEGRVVYCASSVPASVSSSAGPAGALLSPNAGASAGSGWLPFAALGGVVIADGMDEPLGVSD